MTTETKLGLLLGMGVIILVGIFISDHLSKANSQQPPSYTQGELDEADLPPMLESGGAGGDDFVVADEPDQPLPLPDQYDEQPQQRNRPTVRDTAPPRTRDNSVGQQAEAAEERREPRILNQDLPAATALNDPEPEAQPDRGVVIDGDRRVASSDGAASRRTRLPLPEQFERVPQEEVRPFNPDPDHLLGSRRTSTARDAAAQADDDDSRDTGSPSSGSTGSAAREREVATGRSARPVTHYVRENETLSAISREYYGSPAHWEAIYEANRSTITNPNFVRPGVRLVIPEQAGDARRQGGGSASSSASSQDRSAASTRTYTVRENDTLSSIAGRVYGSRAKWQELYELNKDRIDNPDRLRVGTEILVPAH